MRELVPTPLSKNTLLKLKIYETRKMFSVKSKLEELRDYKVGSVIPDRFNFLLLFGFQ